jgi:hypothetical protein
VPPKYYGGTERVASCLTEELVRQATTSSERLIFWSSLVKYSLDLVTVLVAVEAVGVAAWALACMATSRMDSQLSKSLRCQVYQEKTASRQTKPMGPSPE